MVSAHFAFMSNVKLNNHIPTNKRQQLGNQGSDFLENWISICYSIMMGLVLYKSLCSQAYVMSISMPTKCHTLKFTTIWIPQNRSSSWSVEVGYSKIGQFGLEKV